MSNERRTRGGGTVALAIMVILATTASLTIAGRVLSILTSGLITAVITAALVAITVHLVLDTRRTSQGGMPMWRVIKRQWKYLAMKLHLRHEEFADPQVQLEQAIHEARAQHARLTEQAAIVIANQKQAQSRLDRAVAAHAKATAQARQALVLADQEERNHHPAEAASFAKGAELVAGRLLLLEQDISECERALIQATAAAETAKEAVVRNGDALRKRLAEREHLLTDLDQAKMQEQLNAAMRQLAAGIGDDVPTFDEVRRKVDQRLARAGAASGIAELDASIDPVLVKVENAQLAAEAQARLAALRTELRLPTPARRALEAPER